MRRHSDNQVLDEIKSSKIYTLAHAVRSKKKFLEKKHFPDINQQPRKLIQPEVSQEVKHELEKNLKAVLPRQPRSHLPMKMIVSKMATRKRPNDENMDPVSKLDLSTYRKYQLEPPPWRNTLNSFKRQRPSELEKLLSSMKEKCAEFDSSLQHNSLTKSKIPPTLKQQTLEYLLSDSNLPGCDALNTPRLDYNYNKLYRETHTEKENHNIAVILDEDPLGVDSTDWQTSKVNHFKKSSIPIPLSPKVSAEAMPDAMPEFVWNPVVLFDNSKSQLFPNKETETTPQLSPSKHPPLNHCQELPSCFDTPTWDSSSTNSEHTVAEELLQLTIIANRGNMSMFGQNLRRYPHSSGI